MKPHESLCSKIRQLWATSMKYLSLCFLFILVISLSATAQNHVLSLDGDGDYVQLPSDIFNDLDAATIEFWAKWEAFQYYSQPVGFGENECIISLLY